MRPKKTKLKLTPSQSPRVTTTNPTGPASATPRANSTTPRTNSTTPRTNSTTPRPARRVLSPFRAKVSTQSKPHTTPHPINSSTRRTSDAYSTNPTNTASAATAHPVDDPSLLPTDPRWVLAMRVWSKLQGDILPSDKRESLTRLGVTFGLTLFEANLIIAIVQDRARRGQTPHDAITTLKMIRDPKQNNRQNYRRSWKIASWCVALIALECLLAYHFLG